MQLTLSSDNAGSTSRNETVISRYPDRESNNDTLLPSVLALDPDTNLADAIELRLD